MGKLQRERSPDVEGTIATDELIPGFQDPGVLVDLMPLAAILGEDPEAELMRLNGYASELFGVSGQTLSRNHLEGPAPRFRLSAAGRELDVDQHPIQRTLATGLPLRGEHLSVIRADGIRRDVLASTRLFRPPDGDTRMALATFTDVTELVGERRALTVRNIQQTAITELSFFALAEGELLRVADRALATAIETLGADFAEIVEARDEGTVLVRAADRGDEVPPPEHVLPEEPDTPAARALQARKPVTVEDLTQHPQLSVPARLASYPVRGALAVVIPGKAGDPYGTLAVYTTRARSFGPRDVDFVQAVANLLSTVLERTRIEKELADSRHRLVLADSERARRRAEYLASVGTLAAGIIHEVNNPLNSIMVNAELGLRTLDKTGDTVKVRKVLETVVEEVKRCSAITRDVLELSKADDSPKQPGNVNEIVHRARDLMAAHLQMHDTVVDLDLAEDLPPVPLNPTIMEHVIVNLLSNAAEATQSGVRVRIQTRLEGDRVALIVSDDGPGIPPEHLGKVFNSFFSLRRDKGGTGLGLSLVRRTVEDHGGTIDVQSEPGTGTTFTIRLPAARSGSRV